MRILVVPHVSDRRWYLQVQLERLLQLDRPRS